MKAVNELRTEDVITGNSSKKNGKLTLIRQIQ